MTSTPQPSTQTWDSGLESMIEPLASFICAADRPTAALKTPLST